MGRVCSGATAFAYNAVCACLTPAGFQQANHGACISLRCQTVAATPLANADAASASLGCTALWRAFSLVAVAQTFFNPHLMEHTP